MNLWRICVGVCATVVLWGLVAGLHLIDPLFLADPVSTLSALAELLATKRAVSPTIATLRRVSLALLIGSTGGICLGLILGWSRSLYAYCEVVIDFFRSTPVVALFPLFMVIFGLGDPAKVATASWATMLLVLVNTTYGVQAVKQVRLDVCRSLGATRAQVFLRVVLPESLPHIIAGFRVAVSISLIVTIMTEMFLGTKEGLGKEIYNAGLLYNTAALYAWIVLTGFLGYSMNKLVMIAERHLIHWSGH